MYYSKLRGKKVRLFKFKDYSALTKVKHKQEYEDEFKFRRFLTFLISFQSSNYKL